jgi:hypothetical protein
MSASISRCEAIPPSLNKPVVACLRDFVLALAALIDHPAFARIAPVGGLALDPHHADIAPGTKRTESQRLIQIHRAKVEAKYGLRKAASALQGGKSERECQNDKQFVNAKTSEF